MATLAVVSPMFKEKEEKEKNSSSLSSSIYFVYTFFYLLLLCHIPCQCCPNLFLGLLRLCNGYGLGSPDGSVGETRHVIFSRVRTFLGAAGSESVGVTKGTLANMKYVVRAEEVVMGKGGSVGAGSTVCGGGRGCLWMCEPSKGRATIAAHDHGHGCCGFRGPQHSH